MSEPKLTGKMTPEEFLRDCGASEMAIRFTRRQVKVVAVWADQRDKFLARARVRAMVGKKEIEYRWKNGAHQFIFAGTRRGTKTKVVRFSIYPTLESDLQRETVFQGALDLFKEIAALEEQYGAMRV